VSPRTFSRRRLLKGSLLLGALAAARPREARAGLLGLGAGVPWHRRGPKATYNVCDMCPWRCGIVVQTVNGRVCKIDGNPRDPKSRGKLCARGQAGASFLYDPDRLKEPAVRIGPRGRGELRGASWEEALDRSARGLLAVRDRYGPEAVAFLGHTSGDFWFVDHLAQAWGSPNAAKPSTSLCTSPREEAAILTLGRGIGNHEPVDWDECRCLVLIGTHIGEDARNTTMQDLARARARGARLVVVDPRYSAVATKADAWLPIRPGTDTALLLAWMNVLLAEGLVDREFVDRWTVGFERLAEHVAAATPEWAAPLTDLPAARIRETARMLGSCRPRSVVVPGRHVTWYGNDTQRMRAVYILNALLGAYGRPGGLYFSRAPWLEEHPHPPYQVTGGAGG
jgi:thiosulfate reductase/polysulfide reductase chain A